MSVVAGRGEVSAPQLSNIYLIEMGGKLTQDNYTYKEIFILTTNTHE